MSQSELMDLSPDKYGEGERNETEGKKLCADCKTTKTPLWRIGPHGPKSLCNACGIKFRKKKGNGGGGAVMGLKKESSDKKKKKLSPASSSTSTTATTATIATATTNCSGKKGTAGNNSGVNKGKNGKLGSKMKVKLMGLGIEVVLMKRPRSPMKRQRSFKKLGEVEQAALLLMAMSSDSVYAFRKN